MFERFTQEARRTIYLARSEAIHRGARMIGTAHLLAGLLHENPEAMQRHLNLDLSELAGRLISDTTSETPVSSAGRPLSNTSRRVLAYAAQEADQMKHRSIGTEHLLLGIMHESQSSGALALEELGAPPLKEVRNSIKQSGLSDPNRRNENSYSPATRTSLKFTPRQR
jgi:ATP-dependent Clp protease ATP-binding subunit ClpC